MAHAQPPGLPDVVDEAGETPMWIPILGLCLLGLVGLWIVVARGMSADEPPAEATPAAAAAEAEAEAEEAEGEPEEGTQEPQAEPAEAEAH